MCFTVPLKMVQIVETAFTQA